MQLGGLQNNMNKLSLDFSGGMNSHTTPLLLKDNESELILNYNLDKVGALTRRNGYSLFSTVSLFYLSGLIGVMNPNTRTGLLYTTTNDAIEVDATVRKTYYKGEADAGWVVTDDITAKPFQPVTGAANEIYPTRFVLFLNYVFRLTGGDAPLSFLISTPQTKTTTNLTDTETSAALAIIPSLGAVFQDRVYFNRAADGFRSRLYYSTLGVSGGTITWNTNTSTGQWFDVNPDDGDFITALENNGNHLLIFKNYAMYRWIFGQVEADRIIGVGTASQESVKTNFELGITFFANSKGIYAYDGNRPKLISGKIQEYIDAVTNFNWRYCAGHVDKDHYYLSVGDITVNSRTISNAWFVYNILLDAWTIHSLAMHANVFADVGDTVIYPNKRIVFNADLASFGFTYNLSTVTYDLSSTTTQKTIDAEILTKEHLLVFPEKTKLENIDVIAIQGGDTKVSYQIDRNLTGKEGDFISCKERLNERVNTLRVGKKMHTVRLRLADNSQRSSIIEGYNLEHTPQNDR